MLGGVMRAAGYLNLTQSAVSMQIRRLEDSLGVDLLDRSARKVVPTAAGEHMLSYARRMLALNDEVYGLLTRARYEGDLTLGVPHDIVYPAIPQILQRFAADFPKVKVRLLSSFTRMLKEQFARGECDVIVTTEDVVETGGETLTELPLIWVGAPGGVAWRQRPLPLAYEQRCIFRQGVQARLDAAGCGRYRMDSRRGQRQHAHGRGDGQRRSGRSYRVGRIRAASCRAHQPRRRAAGPGRHEDQPLRGASCAQSCCGCVCPVDPGCLRRKTGAA